MKEKCGGRKIQMMYDRKREQDTKAKNQYTDLQQKWDLYQDSDLHPCIDSRDLVQCLLVVL